MAVFTTDCLGNCRFIIKDDDFVVPVGVVMILVKLQTSFDQKSDEDDSPLTSDTDE